MTLSSISAASAADDSSLLTPIQQARSEFKQLAQALQSGDLGAAQSAYSALTQNSSFQAWQSNSNNPVAQDFTVLGKALQSGSVSDAQQAFARLKQDAASSNTGQAVPSTHRGHHHHADSDQDASSASTSSATSSTASATSGSIVNVTG